MLEAFKNTLKVPEIKKKIFFTLLILVVYRLGATVPTPGIDTQALSQVFARIAGQYGSTLFGIMNMFTGGALQKCTIFALGIMPYISASIIIQLLTVVIPHLEKLSKEGAMGRKKIVQYTRYGTVVLSAIQALFISMWLENPANFNNVVVVPNPGLAFRLLVIITLTAGTAFIMWLGEQITEKGIGNGISLIIAAGILSRVPRVLQQTWIMLSPFNPDARQIDLVAFGLMCLLFVAVVVSVILIIQGQRKIPVQYARRVVGRKVYGGQSTYIPLKVNQAGVIPIIFASSILMFPATMASILPGTTFVKKIAVSLQYGNNLYIMLEFLFIVFFTFFYTAITFNPIEISDMMKRNGGFIPGIRPGESTAKFLDGIMVRITSAGAIFLAIIAILPMIIYKYMKIPFDIASFFGGTGLLIIVGVLLDTMKQLESQLLTRHYEGFVARGKLRGRR
jgi:preprotein translocase subunit SecY